MFTVLCCANCNESTELKRLLPEIKWPLQTREKLPEEGWAFKEE
jgi:hypothetical protein